MRAWGIIWLVLLAGLASAGEDEARATYIRHRDRGFSIAKRNGGVLSVEEVRLAAAEFGRAGSAAAEAGLYVEAVTVLEHRIELLKVIFDYAGLLEASEDLLRIQMLQGPEADEARHVTRLDIGQLHHYTGNPGLGIPYLKSAYAFFADRGDPFLAAFAQLRIADCYRDTGQYAAALREAEPAFSVIKSGEDLEEYLGALGVLGRLYQSLGNRERAETLYREGLRLSRKAHPLYRAEFHLSLARLTPGGGGTGKAKERLHSAYGLFMEHADHASAARALLHLALLEYNAGRPGVTIAYCALALRLGHTDPYVRCHANLLSGEAHLARKRNENARGKFEDARKLGESASNPALLGWAESALAEVSLQEHRIPEAVEHTRRALVAMGLTGQGLSVMTATRVRPEMQRLADRAVRAAFAVKDPAVAFELLERSRACTLVCALGGRESLLGSVLDRGAQTRFVKARAEIVTARCQIRMATNRNDREDAAACAEVLRQAFDDFRLASERLGRDSPSAIGPAAGEIVSLANAQASLEADEALILYAFGGGRLRALVLREGEVTRHDLGVGSEVCETVAAIHDAYRGAGSPAPVGRLRELVLDPLELGPGVRRVMVSPDGPLATMPLAALLPDREVAFVPSATSRSLLLAQRPARGKRVLAIGDPLYSDGSREAFAQLHRGAGSLYRLINSGPEIMAATELTDTKLLREDATEARFREELKTESRWRVIHFACHGVVDRRQPGWSALAITPQGADDGYLAVAEILTMRIPADLAILSACSTGVGKTYRGEGMIALPGAFLHAGTPRVIASLWKVDDKATRAMMAEFYRHWRPKGGGEGLKAAAALKKAQQVLRDGEFRDPRHWAAWVLWGLPD